MATKLFLRSTASDYGTGTNDAKLDGAASPWNSLVLSTTAGAGLVISGNTSTVAGPTNGVDVTPGVGSAAVWYSPPIDADVTISGSITWNIWASENNMSANVAINGILEVIDGATGAITEIDRTARVTEVAVTTRALDNFAETPAAGIVCKRGDRLRVRIFGDDAGTMASGFTFNISYNGPTGAADGDTWLSLTETVSFTSEPAGSQVFPTDTASPVATASVDREAWTSRGAGVQTDVTNTAAGYTAPIQVTDTAGGTVVDWFTKQLTAFTIGGAVRVNARAQEAAAAANAAIRCEIAVVDNDGTNPTVWAEGTFPTEIDNLGEQAKSFLISGDDLAVADGQRLRIRFFIDDPGVVSMGAASTVTLFYAGTSGGASGDTFLTFTQTLTEFVAAGQTPRPNPYTQLLAH